jgi:hypothetical protein
VNAAEVSCVDPDQAACLTRSAFFEPIRAGVN